MIMPFWVQCVSCSKWREFPEKELTPDDIKSWKCSSPAAIVTNKEKVHCWQCVCNLRVQFFKMQLLWLPWQGEEILETKFATFVFYLGIMQSRRKLLSNVPIAMEGESRGIFPWTPSITFWMNQILTYMYWGVGGFVHHLQILNLNMNCYCLMNREKRKQLAHVVFQKMRYVKNGSNRNL